MTIRGILLLMLLTGVHDVHAQLSEEDARREKLLREKAAQLAADTSKRMGWRHVMLAGVNLTQVSFKDWAQGGESALSYTLFLNGSSAFEHNDFTWSNTYHFAFGQTRVGSEGTRKTDDEIYDEALLVYEVGTFLNPYASATFRTQFATGYVYDEDGLRTQVSQFLDPAYFTQSLGVGFKPLPGLTTRLGLAVREIFTSRFTKYAHDPSRPGTAKTGVKGGLESVIEAAWHLNGNLTLNSRLEVFSPLGALERLYVRNESMITARVTKFLSTSLGVQVLHDLNASPRTQVKEALAMGLAVTIL